MIRTLYIHIGTPKTGTSTLQHFFEDNRAALLQKGIYYPESISYKRVGGYESTAGNFAWVTRINWDMEELRKTVEGMFEVSNNVLLSTEHIWLEIGDKGDFLLNLKRMLEDTEIKVIVYLRRQIDYLESQYREYVRVILTQEPIFEVCDSSNPTLSEVKESLDYYAVLENMAQAIGRENIIVRIYEKNQFKNSDIVEDFLDILGLKLDKGFRLPKKNYNPPIRNAALELKRYMNSSGSAEQKLMNDCFYDIFMKDGIESDGIESDGIESDGKKGECTHFKSLLTAQQRLDFMKGYADGNEKIAIQYLNRENGILFYDVDDVQSQAATVSTVDLLQQTIRIFTSAFLENYKERCMINEKLEQMTDELQRQFDEQKKQLQEKYEKDQERMQIHMYNQQKQWKKCIKRMQNEISEIKNSTIWKVAVSIKKLKRNTESNARNQNR